MMECVNRVLNMGRRIGCPFENEFLFLDKKGSPGYIIYDISAE